MVSNDEAMMLSLYCKVENGFSRFAKDIDALAKA